MCWDQMSASTTLAKKGIGAISGLVNGGDSAPTTASPSTAPTKSTAEVEAAREKEKQLALMRKGRSSTILTSPSMATGAGTGSGKTLLGS